jgi:ankyrin repeat protein
MPSVRKVSCEFLVAVLNGDTEQVKLLLSQEGNLDINEHRLHLPLRVYCSGKTYLCVAAEKGRFKIVKLLLGHGAAINQQDNNGATPLFVATKRGSFTIVMLLLGHGANINQQDNNGATPLFVATERGTFNIVKLLLEHGADINQTTMGQHPCLWPQKGTDLRL